jgi:2-oxoisovalerate dehydrogenase E2 component (dihydrolipoyl transacylase)
MSQFVFKMPDLGEGTVDAEIVAWRTKPGDVVTEDQLIVEVMTDKAAVEVPAPVSGRVVSITGEPGDKVAVGSPLIVFETGSGGGGECGAARLRRSRPPAPRCRRPGVGTCAESAPMPSARRDSRGGIGSDIGGRPPAIPGGS